MKTPIKTQKVFEQMRNDILQRKYAPGTFLPKEVVFAKQLGISRSTLRNVLAMLADESLVQRIRGYGTYVSEMVPRKKITFLLPCVNVNTFLDSIHQGVIEGAREFNCELESLAVSPTNNPEDIDWSKLFNLNSESLVIVSGFWFQKIFSFLKASKCKVAVIHDQLRQSEQLNQFLSAWCDIVKLSCRVTHDMAAELFKYNVTRPLFFLHYLKNDKYSYLQEVLQDACKALAVEVVPTYINIDESKGSKSLNKRRKLLEECYQQTRFDGCLVDDNYSYLLIRELFPQMPCGFFNLKQYYNMPFDNYAFYSDYPYFEIGYQAVCKLIAPDASQGKRIEINGIINNCKNKNNIEGEE